MEAHEILSSLGVVDDHPGAFAGTWIETTGEPLDVIDPTTGSHLATIRAAAPGEYGQVVDAAEATFRRWRELPAPQRGAYVRALGDALRSEKEALGRLVTLEMGKILPEGVGEVQEMVDICDFAVGLSRQLYGLTMPSERPSHRMYEHWHPLGPVGVISAFNFPVAVWSWNAAIAAVCGDTIVWKPSERTPLTAIAVTRIAEGVMAGTGFEAVFSLIVGTGPGVGASMTADPRLPLISATGSTRMGRIVGPAVAQRFGRSLLDLGGNNAAIVLPDADLDLATRAIVFGAVGTAGQRCTTLRRVLAHEQVVDDLTDRLVAAYATIPIGDPLDDGTLMGPLVGERAIDAMQFALARAEAEGGMLVHGGRRVDRKGFFVEPAIVRIDHDAPITHEETFAPILYVSAIGDVEEGIAANNGVSQGLSSAIFSDSVRATERFLSHAGSDAGIANVNIGTSGAEIGGAFGGEKETGGGREAGSDAWKAYMRRQTTTINWGDDLPLAQGIEFG
jgi:aldehyde dehydrogenase (NAD+)